MSGEAAARPQLPIILALCIIPVLAHLTIVATSHVPLTLRPGLPALFKLGFVTASALTNWIIYASLLVTFALTLRPGHEALITAMARKMHGDMHGNLEPELAVYTRRVTIAWCCFFAAQLATSITLFCLTPLVVWSFFVNILDIPLVVAMFSAEYFCRLRCLRNPPRHSLAVIVKMVTESAGGRNTKQPIPASATQPD